MFTPELVPCSPEVCMILPRALKTLQKHLSSAKDIKSFHIEACGSLEDEQVPAFKVYLQVYKMTGTSRPYLKVFTVKGSTIYGFDTEYGWENFSEMSLKTASTFNREASESYRLTSSELGAVDFAYGKGAMWAELVQDNLRGNTLTLNNMQQHEMNEAILEEGLVYLDGRTELASFLHFLQPT